MIEKIGQKEKGKNKMNKIENYDNVKHDNKTVQQKRKNGMAKIMK